MSVQLGGWAVYCRPSSGHQGTRRQRQCLWGTLGEWTPSSALGAEGICSREALDWRITASFQAPSCPDDTGLGPSVPKEWTVDSVGTGMGSGPGWSVPDVGLGNVPQAVWALGVWTRPSPRPLPVSGFVSFVSAGFPGDGGGPCLQEWPSSFSTSSCEAPQTRVETWPCWEVGSWGWKGMNRALPLKPPSLAFNSGCRVEGLLSQSLIFLSRICLP